MKKLFDEKKLGASTARGAMRKRQWSKALEFYEARVKENERDFSLWNLIGDLAMNAKSRSKAVDAWRRALEGYAADGLHENALGVARKVLRRTPEEDDIYLQMADAYLGMEYLADCLQAIRSYIKLAKQRSESDLRSMFKRVMDCEITHSHLLDELSTLYVDSGVEDLELQRKLEQYIATQRTRAPQTTVKIAEPTIAPAWNEEPVSMPVAAQSFDMAEANGLRGLESSDDSDGYMPVAGYQFMPASSDDFGGDDRSHGSNGNGSYDETSAAPTNEGKDHYDLGMVYREMKLWDAAIGEFEKSKSDPALRMRSTLALAECLQESGDLQAAVALLEKEKETSGGSETERMGLHFQLGLIHEVLGNLDEALQQFEWVRSKNKNHAEAEQKVQSLSKRLGKSSAR